MGVELWAEAQRDRYRLAIDNAWDDFEEAYNATIKRVGIHSMAATHAQNYRRRGRLLKDMVDGLLAKPTRSDSTPEAIRNAVAELVQFKVALNKL